MVTLTLWGSEEDLWPESAYTLTIAEAGIVCPLAGANGYTLVGVSDERAVPVPGYDSRLRVNWRCRQLKNR